MHMTAEMQKEQEQIADVMGKIKRKVVVMSNKGGVGKSTVTAALAVLLAKQGFSVGILDADIHGPSQAKIFGLEDRRIEATEDKKIVPLQASGAIKLVTTAGFLEHTESPLLWRGPLKVGLIKQFIKDADWGTLDYLLVDSPPGTGDEPMTLLQTIPDVSAVVIVTTPQEMALLDSKKAVNFVKQMQIPFVGIIENMSGYTCPHCGKDIALFKSGGGEKAAQDMGVDFMGRLPFKDGVLHSMEGGSILAHENDILSVMSSIDISHLL